MKKRWKVQAFLKNGPMVLPLIISETKVKLKSHSIRFEFFFNEPESVYGWTLQELLMPKVMYRVITKGIRKGRFFLDRARISCFFSKNGNSIVITIVRRLAKVYSVPNCAISVVGGRSKKSKNKKNREKTFSPFRFVSS